MGMKKSQENLMNAFETLRKGLKDASIEAIQQDKYSQSRQLTEIMEQLTALEQRTSAALGGELPDETMPADKPTSDKSKEYPRFYRVGNTLYKEGLRQDGKSVYTQKVDRQSFEAIVKAVAAQGKCKFKPAQLVDQLDQPSYQVYILLKILQDSGFVRNPERGAYQLDASAKSLDPQLIWEDIEQQLAH
jgi:hypothetical protein